MTLICYLTAGAVNLFWLILGDRLSLPVQMAIPILTVLLAGTGVLLRLRKLRGEQRRRYRTGPCGSCCSTTCASCRCCCFSAGCSTWTGAMAGL